ncbi:hypothetical protein [Pseudokineococcus sp. 1T1Z-3]|uniref:hypothetical protein n=1 Tax=Pseudokineococcus sp. 1T1Z-3 TaxID=3132745 RepID=UPI0030A5C4FA
MSTDVPGRQETTGEVLPDVPSPLGWCSPCLGARRRTPAGVLLDGTGLCEGHHEQALAGQQAQGDQMAAMAAQAQEQLRGLMGGGFGAGPGGPRRAGF